MPDISIFTEKEAIIAKDLVQVIYCNPFLEERKILDQKIATSLPRPGDIKNNSGSGPYIKLLLHHCETLLNKGKSQIEKLPDPQSHPQFQIYEHLVYFHLFHQLAPSMDDFIGNCIQQPEKNFAWNDYRKLVTGYDFFLSFPNKPTTPAYTKTELASFVYQIRRAFYHTTHSLIGQSAAMVNLRARVWNSVFTHNMRRYLRSLFNRMENVVTLIEGPSGSGKELVARAIGFSRYIPFDANTRKFQTNYRQVFFPINLSALSETLIESELFGHQKGAFTGALQNRAGYFESCGAYGTVFLDEIGETDPSVQVKLLRVLQTRQFQRLGDTQSLRFEGKLMAATNRNLEREMHEGNFRTDFYYRLCADRINTPSLLSILKEDKKELDLIVEYIAGKVAGEDEKENLTSEVTTWIRKSMPANYGWPGNFRELEQCVRNVMVHGEYQPQKIPSPGGSAEEPAFETSPTLNQWIQVLVNREYAKTPNLAQVADRLQVDRRTVKKYLSFNS
jgi:DNA-binding NtrC family response regulator